MRAVTRRGRTRTAGVRGDPSGVNTDDRREPARGAPRACAKPLGDVPTRRSAAEVEPVHVHEVLRLAAREGQIDVMGAGDRADVRGHRPPGLPAPGVGDRETADRCARTAVESDLDQPAHPGVGAGGHPGDELGGGRGTEVDVLEERPVAVREGADVLAAAGVGRGLGESAALAVVRLGLDGAVRVTGARRRRCGGASMRPTAPARSPRPSGHRTGCRRPGRRRTRPGRRRPSPRSG